MAMSSKTKMRLVVLALVGTFGFVGMNSGLAGVVLTYMQQENNGAELTPDSITQAWGELFSDASDNCAPANVMAAPNADNTVSSDATLPEAVKAVVGSQPRLAASMLTMAYAETSGDPNFSQDGAIGPYKIQSPGTGDHAGITIDQAKNPAYATNYMAPIYKNAINRVDPEKWKTDPVAAIGELGFYANGRPVEYSLGVRGKIQEAYDRALKDMQQEGISTNLESSVAVDPGSGAPTVVVDSDKTVVVLDPGHGGEVPEYVDDKTGLADRETTNSPEREDVLDVANQVKAQLEAAGYKVVLTRTIADEQVSKRRRVDIASEAKADLVVSIHTSGDQGYNYTWPQRVGTYREYQGTRVTITNEAVARLSQQYSQNIADARAAVEGHSVSQDPNNSAQRDAFSREDVPSKGNASILQVWGQDMPWVYNEIQADPAGLSMDMKSKYVQGLVEGIKKSLPATVPSDRSPPAQQPATSQPSGQAPVSSAAPATDDSAVLQRLFVGVFDPEVAKEIVDKYRNVGGVFLGSSGSPGRVSDQLKGVIPVLQSSVDVPLFIATDQELVESVNSFGLVKPNSTPLDHESDAGVRTRAKNIGTALAQAGVNMDFAPVVDLQDDDNPAIGAYGRGISDDPEDAADKGTSAANGFLDANVAPVAKHFPGHGRTATDSHSELAVTPDLSDLSDNDLVPFRAVAGMDKVSIMMGHLVVPGLTDDVPASLSPKAYQYLRNDLGFKGVTITDELGMNGASFGGSVGNRIVTALNAGADMALFNVTSLEQFEQYYNEVKGKVTTSDDNRIVKLKQAFGLLKIDDSPTPATEGTMSVTTVGSLDANMVPEPMRSIMIKAANAHNVPPAAVAALYLTENNGFPFTYAEYDGKGKAAYSSLTPTSPEWKLAAYGQTGNWAPNSGSFQGPFQFGTPAWSTYGTDADGDGTADVRNFTDAAYAAAAYLQALGAKNGDLASVVEAARQYNGQVSWSPGGSSIRNPDPGKFQKVQHLYAYQVGELTTALSGGDTSGNSVAVNCISRSNSVVQGISTEYGVDGQRKQVIDAANSQAGVPYSWGGGTLDGPSKGIRDGGVADSFGDYNKVGFDCSGLTLYALARGGIKIPDTTASGLWQLTRSHQVSQEQAQPGDLVFFGYDPAPHHIGIYLGNDQMINAPQSGDVVKVSKVSSHNDLLGYTDPYAWSANGGR